VRNCRLDKHALAGETGLRTGRTITLIAAGFALTAAALVRDGRQHANSRDQLLKQQGQRQEEMIKRLDLIAQEIPQLNRSVVVQPPPPPPRLPWIKQEAFRQGIAIEAIGAVIAAAFIYLFGVAFGWIKNPKNWAIILSYRLQYLRGQLLVPQLSSRPSNIAPMPEKSSRLTRTNLLPTVLE
jgi:hypothetical protein